MYRTHEKWIQWIIISVWICVLHVLSVIINAENDSDGERLISESRYTICQIQIHFLTEAPSDANAHCSFVSFGTNGINKKYTIRRRKKCWNSMMIMKQIMLRQCSARLNTIYGIRYVCAVHIRQRVHHIAIRESKSFRYFFSAHPKSAVARNWNINISDGGGGGVPEAKQSKGMYPKPKYNMNALTSTYGENLFCGKINPQPFMCVSFYIFTVISASTFLYYGNNCLCVCSLAAAATAVAPAAGIARTHSFLSSPHALLLISTICVCAEYTKKVVNARYII